MVVFRRSEFAGGSVVNYGRTVRIPDRCYNKFDTLSDCCLI